MSVESFHKLDSPPPVSRLDKVLCQLAHDIRVTSDELFSYHQGNRNLLTHFIAR